MELHCCHRGYQVRGMYNWLSFNTYNLDLLLFIVTPLLGCPKCYRVLVRLAIFWNSGYKMVLHGGESVNIEKGRDAYNSQQRQGHFANPGNLNGTYYYGQAPWNLEGRALSALSRFGANARMLSEPTWLLRVQHQQAIMEPPSNCIFINFK